MSVDISGADITMKVDEYGAFGQLLLQLKKATVLAESSEYIHVHRDLSAPAISTDMRQLGVALFPSF